MMRFNSDSAFLNPMAADADSETLRNIFARYVEEAPPATFAERMALQMRAMRDVAARYGLPLTTDRVEHYGAVFADVCPNVER